VLLTIYTLYTALTWLFDYLSGSLNRPVYASGLKAPGLRFGQVIPLRSIPNRKPPPHFTGPKNAARFSIRAAKTFHTAGTAEAGGPAVFGFVRLSKARTLCRFPYG
jgi:hypothetical protein